MNSLIRNKKKYLLYLLTGFTLLKIAFEIQYRYRGYQVLINDFNQNKLFLCINIILVLLFSVGAFSRFKESYQKFLVGIVTGLFLLILIGSFLFSSSDPVYYEFTFDNESTIVIEENAWLLGGWSKIYIRRNVIYVESIGKISTDDGYRPFSSNNYSFIWLDKNTLEISYGFGQADIIKKEVIEID